MYTYTNIYSRRIGCLKLQFSFRTRATNYSAFLSKMMYKDHASTLHTVSDPSSTAATPCVQGTNHTHLYIHITYFSFSYSFSQDINTYSS